MNWLIFLIAFFVPFATVSASIEFWQWNINKADERKRDTEIDTRNTFSHNTAGKHGDNAYADTLRLFYE